jgi:uncharacterized membrane protein
MTNQVTKSITVKADPQRVYEVWADFENFPMFMRYIKSVTKTGDGTSHWKMEGPLGIHAEWDAETTRMDPGQRIAWNSKQHSSLTTSGQVTFTPLPEGETQVMATIQYDPPAGWPGEVVTDMFGDPEGKLEADLLNFKNFIEGRIDQTQQKKHG